jgi:hypothetical protein
MKLTVEVRYRDFGLDPQRGINNLCIDRVTLRSEPRQVSAHPPE